MSLKAIASQNGFSVALKTVHCLHNKNFQIGHETRELQSVMNVAESVDLLLCSPLYNVRHQQGTQNGDHDVLNGKDM